jgi:type VI secretion system secreted protein VgrG
MADGTPLQMIMQAGIPWDGVTAMVATIATGDDVDVRHFRIVERMSSLFDVRIVAVSKNPDIDFEGAIGHPMQLAARGSANRTWTGICTELRQVRVEENNLSTYELVLAPTLWLATQRRNYRMFQHMSELDIVLKLLAEWGIEPRLQLTSQYKKRKYRVQYRETDYTFICRMLEDAGISFYWDSLGDGGLVLDDAPHANTARLPIAFRDTPHDALHEHVTKVHVARRVRPGRYTVRDHDYRRPASYKLLGTAIDAPDVEKRLERFHYIPGSFLYESDRGDATPSADDKGQYRPDDDNGAALAERRLEAQRADIRETSFKTNTLGVAPSTVLSFLDHPKTELGPTARLLVIESVVHGSVPGDIEHNCVALSADQPYRPPLVTPKPRAEGVESATVVGPAGEEIHVDEFGRVRVHFHWDRESQMNENSSCWIHVSQAWGGSGFGGTNLPRIGQEVIVDFLGGDPDRPLVTGRVYTNLTKTPYSLPTNKTQSGWKSNSSPTTGGYNEIMFEDKAGEELVRTQAEKDMHKLVKNDENVVIGNDRASNIGHNENRTVGNDSFKQVMQNAMELIGLDRTRGVGNDEQVKIGRNQLVDVGEKIEIVCGKSKLVMDKEGNILLQGVKITVAGSEHVQVWSKLIDLN